MKERMDVKEGRKEGRKKRRVDGCQGRTEMKERRKVPLA
jgi:hypothetical protein